MAYMYVSECWTKLVECNALQVAVHFEKCTALQKIAVHLLQKCNALHAVLHYIFPPKVL